MVLLKNSMLRRYIASLNLPEGAEKKTPVVGAWNNAGRGSGNYSSTEMQKVPPSLAVNSLPTSFQI